MSDREMMLRRLGAAQFAVWELHIFLDTHPDNRDAMALFKKKRAAANALTAQYISKYGPLSNADVTQNNRWQWIKGPWPWERSEEAKANVGL